MWCPVYVLTLMHDYRFKEIFMLGKRGVTYYARSLVRVVQNEGGWKHWDYVLKILDSGFWASNSEEKLRGIWSCEQDSEKLTY